MSQQEENRIREKWTILVEGIPTIVSRDVAVLFDEIERLREKLAAVMKLKPLEAA